MRKFLANRCGVTPVLSSVLLMIVAVAAMSLAASATYVITDNMRQIMGERAIVEDVWFTANGISIYLRNVGKVPVTVSSTYVNFSIQPFTALIIEVEEHGWLNMSYSWVSNGLYNINIVTTKGSKIMDYYNAPP
ncbi:hypothetical protein E3J51_04210 [Candidatus Bathyarchaeota archaeon]|nr:MAG: hypothetical protein E3J51_04210 [Candidatus Bathyarchaeota archaeon]